jgi:ATP/maltotriose-dependent transcriptional regulator MalT
MLCNVAHVAFLRGDATESVRWATEAIQLAEELKDRDLQATLRCVCAHAHVALGEWDDGAACYRASLALFREIGRSTMVAEPLAGLARIALARGDVEGAMATIAEVRAHFDAGGSVDGTEDPLWIYLTCHQVLAAAGEPKAADFLRRAHALVTARAAPLGDAERATFLANVPSHRAIVDAWRGAIAQALPAAT